MRIQWLAAMLAAVAIAGVAQAQPAKLSEPTVELRLRSVNDLFDKGEYVGGLVGQEELVKQVKRIAKTMTKEKTGLQGVDPSRPFGLYANLSVDVINSPVILMVPIADKESFLKLLKDKDITTEKAEDDTIKVFVPFVNELFMRFANDYLYVGRTIKDLDPNTLISPKTFFAKDDKAIASLIVRFDRIPEDVKKTVLGQFELQVAEQRRANGAKEDKIEKAFLDFLSDGVTGGLKTFLDDAKELNARFFIDDKSDEISADVTLTAKQGSTLAKTLASLGDTSSVPAAIVGAGKDPVVRVTTKGGLTPDLKKRFAKVFDEVSEDIVKKVEPTAQAVVRQALEVWGPTIKGAEIDGAIALNGPDAKGRFTLILAGAVKQGKEIEKLLKELALSAGPVADFDFDKEKIGDFTLHKITLNEAPPELEQTFGTKTFWLAVSDSYLVLSVEPDGAAIRAGLKSKPAVAPTLSVNVSVSKLLPIIAKDLKPDEVKAVLKDAFGDESSVGKDTIAVTITGGEQLNLKAKFKGKVVSVFFAVDQLKKK